MKMSFNGRPELKTIYGKKEIYPICYPITFKERKKRQIFFGGGIQNIRNLFIFHCLRLDFYLYVSQFNTFY